MALPPSTANWHWKNKNVTPWGKAWFERELSSVKVQGDNQEQVSVLSVTEVDGDIELGQRKSKLITIYDCKIELEWSGTSSDGTEVKGTLTIPEVSHEITLDGLSDYLYVWGLTTESSPAAQAVLALAKKRLPPALEIKFTEFAADLVATHGKDLQIASTEPSRAATPAPASAPAASATTAETPKETKKAKLNTTKVVVEGSFMASADDLYNLLTDEKKIPMWTRASAKSVPEVGGEFVLFGGGVKGKYVSLTPGKEIVQDWALQSPTWPDNHFGSLTITFTQSSDSTKVVLSLAGVPTGTEDEMTRNLEGYYIHGFKSIGLGSSLSA